MTASLCSSVVSHFTTFTVELIKEITIQVGLHAGRDSVLKCDLQLTCLKRGMRRLQGITLLSVIGKVFCNIFNNRLVERQEKGRLLHEGQADLKEVA